MKETNDGSFTIYNKEYDETYHSVSGALEETYEKFIKPCKIKEISKTGQVSILDIGFGLGYNAIAAIDDALSSNSNCEITIVSLEKDLILDKLKKLKPKLKHYWIIEKLEFDPITSSYLYEDAHIHLKIKIGKAEETIKKLTQKFDAVFLDPFSPKKNPELWTEEFLNDVANLMRQNSILATYSCARIVRENLKKTGLEVSDGVILGRRGPSTIAKKL